MPNKSYTSIHIFSKQKGQMIWDFSFYQANLVFSGNETEKLKLQDLKEFMKIIELKVIGVEATLTSFVDLFDSLFVFAASSKQALKFG